MTDQSLINDSDFEVPDCAVDCGEGLHTENKCAHTHTHTHTHDEARTSFPGLHGAARLLCVVQCSLIVTKVSQILSRNRKCAQGGFFIASPHMCRYRSPHLKILGASLDCTHTHTHTHLKKTTCVSLVCTVSLV